MTISLAGIDCPHALQAPLWPNNLHRQWLINYLIIFKELQEISWKSTHFKIQNACFFKCHSHLRDKTVSHIAKQHTNHPENKSSATDPLLFPPQLRKFIFISVAWSWSALQCVFVSVWLGWQGTKAPLALDCSLSANLEWQCNWWQWVGGGYRSLWSTLGS